MSKAPAIAYWVCADGMPRKLDDCSREELIRCIHWISGKYAEGMTPEAMRARALGMVEMIKRGER